MITLQDLYTVLCATTPLYFAMLAAYFSVKKWKLFTPVQCTGISRFVSAFAVPVLSFYFISQNNPFLMDCRFILADTVSKVFVLFMLSVFGSFFRGSGTTRLDWVITLFSVSTLPNTLVMGIPLLQAMYGDFTEGLMVQLVVLQCIVWYTLLLFLFEYRAATLLIREQFPGATAAHITTIHVDSDIISLDGCNPFYAESETDLNGRVHVRIRKSTSTSARSPGLTSSSLGMTPRLSNISGAEIYSIQPTPRASNFAEGDTSGMVWGRSDGVGQVVLGGPPSPAVAAGVKVVWETCESDREGQGGKDVGGDKELSFRSTSRFIKDNAYEEENKEERDMQEMPRALVMLRLILIVVGRKLSRNPNTYSSILGLLWSLVSFRWEINMPDIMKNSVKIIADAGLGMAMFSLGLFMGLQPRIIACGNKMAVITMGIKFIGGPLIMAGASIAAGLRGVKLSTAIVQAALPQGIVPFVFAREYDLHPDILSTGVIFGMLVSLPVTLLYYVLLGL
ncbi:hypothetical protein LUZ63_003082 [Rhynchospora breviuscula]|uniref:Auxin efflux carrier component n=1 Tax=Rhynchospora breviuscula TaxID=2022672 RepID=A0A9Q0HZI4_9POAL|nr:hypothetical protein LUZ63_003082 [Rhynchospora breviuscula]